MANTPSAKKRIRTNARKNARNKSYRSKVKTMIKRAEVAIVSAGTEATEDIRQAQRTLDKAAVKGIIHKNNASRRMSRLAARAKAAANAS